MPEDTEAALRSNSISAAINYLHLDADKVLTAFGKYGRYQVCTTRDVSETPCSFQMLAYAVTGSVQILFALNMMIMPFITTSVTPMCDIPESANTVRSHIISVSYKS